MAVYNKGLSLIDCIVFTICRYKLSFGCNDKLQLGSIISTFTQARSAIVAAAK